MTHTLQPAVSQPLDDLQVRIIAGLTARGALVRFCSCGPVMFAAGDVDELTRLHRLHLAAVAAQSMSRHPSRWRP